MTIETEQTPFIYHPIDWSSTKQKQVCYSSYGAEVLAFADAEDKGFHLKESYSSLLSKLTISHKLHFDSRALYDTITTLHEGKDYRIRQTVDRICDSFDSRELDTQKWIPGALNIADGLTKRNAALLRIINTTCATGELSIDMNAGYEVNSRTWR